MRWTSFFILAYLMLGLQAGLNSALAWHNAAPDLPLLAVVFICMNAPRDAALLGSFVLGAMQDLTSQGTPGLWAFSYGLVAMFVVSARTAVYRRHPLSSFLLTLMAGLMIAIVFSSHDWLHPLGEIRTSASIYFISAIYTALLAPFILPIFQHLERAFAFESSGRLRREYGPRH
jgi:rod shape-determining protein MreD